MTAGDPGLPRDLARLLLVRLRSIGDSVLLTPLAEALRAAHPAARIDVALEQPAAVLFARHPHIDRVVEVPAGLVPRLGLLRRIRRTRYDVAIDLHGGSTAAFLTRFSGARLRVGLAAYRFPGAYDVHLPSPFKGPARRVTLHTLESNLAILESLGIPRPPDPRPLLVPSPQGEAEAERRLAERGLAGARGFVVVHPGAALRSKTWSRERFAAVAGALARDGHRVLLVAPPGAPGPAAPPGGVEPLAPLGLAGLVALLARARLFVGNDSGPAHVAAALGVPCVTVFGSQDPRVWRPWGAGHRVVWKGLDCSPCRGRSCANPVAYECLEAIGTVEVLAAAREVLARA